MRSNLVAVGVLLAIIGAALWYYPVQSSTIGTKTVLDGSAQIVERGLPFAVLGKSIPYSVNWQSSVSITIRVYDCGSDSACALFSTGTVIAQQTGVSGSIAWTGDRGQYFAIVPSGGSATTVVNYTEPVLEGLLGVAVFIIGVLIVILGVGLARREPRSAQFPAIVQTTATSTQPGVMVEGSPRRQ